MKTSPAADKIYTHYNGLLECLNGSSLFEDKLIRGSRKKTISPLYNIPCRFYLRRSASNAVHYL